MLLSCTHIERGDRMKEREGSELVIREMSTDGGKDLVRAVYFEISQRSGGVT